MDDLTYIQEFLDSNDYDIRKTGNGRWIDQKCTPDIVWSIADFIINFVNEARLKLDQENYFTVKDIWKSEYAKKTMAEEYSKPETDLQSAENEYDKVFSQPLCLLCYAGVLNDINNKNHRHKYEVNESKILEYIAENDTNSLKFLCLYIEKVLKDSELLGMFERFFENQDKRHFDIMKNGFINFYHHYTPIKKEFEPKRIFTKVLNPLAWKKNKKGTKGGKLSQNKIDKKSLMYRQDNFRDLNDAKPKEITRKDWAHQEKPSNDLGKCIGYQMMAKSKNDISKLMKDSRGGLSELSQYQKYVLHEDYIDSNTTLQMHHIFPLSQYPGLAHYKENIIAITPNQHLGYAHPNGNTSAIDPKSQESLLLAKVYSIEKNLKSKEEKKIYEFEDLLEVISYALGEEAVSEVEENSFDELYELIHSHYESNY